MSYELEAISSSNVPTEALMPMREPRVINPYQSRMSLLQGQSIGQVDTVKEEQKAPEEIKAPEETVKLSPQVAALARREQKFRSQQQQLEKEKALIAQKEAEIAELRALKEKLAKKDYSGLDGLVDYNEYSQYQVNKLSGTDPVQEELKKLQGKISEIEKSAQEQLSMQSEAAVNERRIAVKALVEKSPEYSRIKKTNAHEAVVHHIMDTWENDSIELSVEQAAKEVEELLLEKAKKWAALLEEEKPAPQVEEKKQLPPLKQGLKTLTNQVTAGDMKRPERPLHFMNESERIAEARRRALEKLQLQGAR